MENKELKIAREIERIALENNISVQYLIEQYKKAQSPATKQGKELTKTINDIIPPGTDIDNGQVYIKETGEVLKDLN